MRICEQCGAEWRSYDGVCPECGWNWWERTAYMPTQEEIRRKCKEIQQTWTPLERHLRTATAYRQQAVVFDDFVWRYTRETT